MNSLLDRYCKVLDGITVAFLAIMVVLVFGNVVLRYAFNSGITVSEEMSRWLFVWLTFLGAIVAIKEHGHLGTDMLVSKLSYTGKKVCSIIAHVLMIYVTWLLLQGSWTQAKINWDVEAPVTGLSMAIFYGAGVFFSISAGVLLVRELYRVVAGKATEKELVGVQESEDLKALEELHKGDAAGDVAGVKGSSGSTGGASRPSKR
jgi:TRAP-type C4-dicarboxylate transport system permease small subunit